ncbi:MAG: Lrp/AsnC ligand binding domain-containing protein [Elusimicrobia bacterium]|jgi:DNA-binding Lrp family transcriptional regulator|nr:Lrp/AsnC ligand binding domain-containing protein [Elusimicrobiota bacterium]MDE2510717.1 Lrp/AsnC ligand binding domain-containing protein [Elusimicrobiota bacterium]
MKTFVLCKLTPGKEQSAVTSIRAIDGVTEVYMTFGGWDMILSAEADTVDKLSNLIVSRVRAVPGVSATETLVTTNL